MAQGADALKTNDIDKLRPVVALLDSIRFDSPEADDMMAVSNIVRA